MGSLFSGIHITLSSILSQQQAMQVVGHNVANANTPGYHRQQAVLKAGLPYGTTGIYSAGPYAQMGTGVTVDRVRRFSTELYDTRYRREMSEVKYWGAQADVLSEIEVIMAELTDEGLVSKLDQFWAAWNTLTGDPTSTALRIDLLSSSQSLADGINRRGLELEQARKDQDLGVQQNVDEINSLASQIASLNVQISNLVAVDNNPNDLIDQRDLILDRLSELSGARVDPQENGQVMISISGHVLVIGNETFEVETFINPANDNLKDVRWADGQAYQATRGELKGLIEVRDGAIVDQQNSLDALAGMLISQVNALHQTGFGTNNATGLDFFNGTDAISIEVNTLMDDVANIGAASALNQPGNGDIALQIGQLGEALLLNGGTTTLNDFYIGEVGKLGLAINHAATNANDRSLVANAIEYQREGVSGVSLDEEAANLVRYQRAFEAATRLMTTIDSMIDRIINGMGLVGR